MHGQIGMERALLHAVFTSGTERGKSELCAKDPILVGRPHIYIRTVTWVALYVKTIIIMFSTQDRGRLCRMLTGHRGGEGGCAFALQQDAGTTAARANSVVGINYCSENEGNL